MGLSMKGTILDFSVQSNAGVISGDDQNRYQFNGAEWRENNPPTRGARVDFDVNDEGQAIQVYVAVGHSNLANSFSAQLDKISNQDQAEEQYNMIDWFVKCLKQYVDFTGRARRKEYWFFTLTQFILLIIALLIDYILGTGYLLYVVVALATCIPSLAALVRRLHDTGRSGWWYFISLIPFIGSILLLVWLATEGQKEPNQWGNPVK